MIPVAMAYAELAGVPAAVGLTTAFAAMTAYAILGTSRHLKVTVSSTMAVMSAAVVAPIAAGDAARYLALTAGLALVVGVVLLAAGFARLGFISDFMARSVVTGFVFGLAITIIIGQLPEAARRSGGERPDPGPARQPDRGAAGHQPADPGGRTAVDRGACSSCAW